MKNAYRAAINLIYGHLSEKDLLDDVKVHDIIAVLAEGLSVFKSNACSTIE